MTLRITILASMLVLFGAFFAHAQLSLTGYERRLDLTTTPEYPGPRQVVQLAIKTFAIDLNRSNVTWYENGREIARGAGVVSTTVTTGGFGSETRVDVFAEDDEGITASASVILRPTEIDILWESSSYVPPFYKGRVLAGPNSSVRAQAVARFQNSRGAVSENDLVFTWYKNGAVVGQGRGKSSITLGGPPLFGADTIRVVATSADSTLSGSAAVSIPAIDPFVMLYENHPLFGVLFHRSLDETANTRETEQKVTAVPYFAPISAPEEPSLIYEWVVNGNAILPDPQEPQTLTITTNGFTGPADIGLTIMSSTDLLLRAVGSWQIIFGEDPGGFFTGINPFGGSQ